MTTASAEPSAHEGVARPRVPPAISDRARPCGSHSPKRRASPTSPTLSQEDLSTAARVADSRFLSGDETADVACLTPVHAGTGATTSISAWPRDLPDGPDGFDVESLAVALAVAGDRVRLGLRGAVVDDPAPVVELADDEPR